MTEKIKYLQVNKHETEWLINILSEIQSNNHSKNLKNKLQNIILEFNYKR